MELIYNWFPMKNLFKVIFAALAAVSLVNAGCDKAGKYLRMDPESFNVASDELILTAAIEASASWMAYCPPTVEWLKYTYTEEGLLITINGDNESLEPRETAIDITTGDGQTAVIHILQRAMEAYIDVTPASLAEFDSAGGSQTLAVSTNLTAGWDFGFTGKGSWATAVRGTDEESGILTVGAAQSRELDDRRDSLIIIPVNDAFRPLTDTIPILQRGANLIITWPSMDDAYVIEASAAETALDISVYAKEEWTVGSDDTGDRLSFSLTGGPADIDSGTLMTVTVPANSGTDPYNYILTFTCGGEEYEYELVQAAPSQP